MAGEQLTSNSEFKENLQPSPEDRELERRKQEVHTQAENTDLDDKPLELSDAKNRFEAKNFPDKFKQKLYNWFAALYKMPEGAGPKNKDGSKCDFIFEMKDSTLSFHVEYSDPREFFGKTVTTAPLQFGTLESDNLVSFKYPFDTLPDEERQMILNVYDPPLKEKKDPDSIAKN